MTRAVLLATALALAGAGTARAQATTPTAHDDAAFDVMNVLADHGIHDLDDETWNLYGQFTWINVFRLPWSAPYTNVNGSTFSFGTGYEHAFTDSFTLYGGVKLWHGGELYAAPEVIAEHALSNLHGLGGAIEIYELQKAGAFNGTDPKGADFTAGRVAAGASELRDEIVLAWRASEKSTVGYPETPVSDIESGKIDPYDALYGLD